ncbi:hypothetical protein VCHENC02_0361B, partial [Vibrio harveyi]
DLQLNTRERHKA